ncbi:hypothetical protein ACFLWX_01645 [Chloroflexota bacterium]
METVELDVDLDKDLAAKVHDLAIRYFGDTSDASLAQVLEVAFRMRCLFSRLARMGQQETDEAVSNWEFPEPAVKQENSDSIQDWLFRR